MKEYNARVSRKPAGAKSAAPPRQLKDHIRIYFPTEQTVAKSRGGRGVSFGIPAPLHTHRATGDWRKTER
jgi:hypothetical protein